jgi:uncharacterized protein (TIGR04141 family)
MPRKPKSRQLTIFLIKPELVDPVDILKKCDELRQIPIELSGLPHGILYLQPTQLRPPSWISLFSPVVDIEANLAQNASTAAVWILTVEGQRLALTFGYGRNLLKSGVHVEDFGLRVTLNAVDPKRIKALDRMTLDAVAQQSRIQATREASMSEFGLEVEQDLLRAVTGVPLDESLGARLTGRDALQTVTPTLIEKIPELISRYLEEFAKDDYKRNFPWVDQISEIEDPTRCSALDDQLVEKLKGGAFENVWLSIPEMMDWEGLAGFKYRTGKNSPTMADVHLRSFIDQVGDTGEIDELSLKNRYRVQAISSENDSIIRQWPVYRCLYCEVHEGADTFLLNNGRWFRIASDFVTRVTEAVNGIENCQLAFPEFKDLTEGAYSKRVADTSNGHLELMDQKLVGSSSLPTAIEFCDLLSSDRHLIHLKRYTGSSTLSHLFAQGVVSAKIFLNEADFRVELNAKVSPGNRLADPAAKPDPATY